MSKFFIFLLLLLVDRGFSQTLTLDKVNELARQNYPLIRQKDLIRQTKEITIENIKKGFLPQFAVNGQATYQSDVTMVKIPVPNLSIEPLSKDQYRIVTDVNQLIYDGGFIKQQKNIQLLNADVEEQKIEVELFKLKERINQVYLSILFIDEQLKQTDLIKKDIETGIRKTEAQVNNGVAFRSSLNILKAELLKTDQRTIELVATRTGLLDVLALFTKETYSTSTVLEKPILHQEVNQQPLQRPELKLFQSQQQLFDGQTGLIKTRAFPKTNLFFQGGYGRPGLNMLENKFALFYITGVRFNWSLGWLYTSKQEKEIIQLNKQSVTIQQDAFVLNTNSQLKQQQAEINKINQLILKDLEIIELRSKVKEAANAQLENGVITANDYLREVNAEDQARQNLIVHQLQLLQAQINYQTILGK
jgi:outer membrane protein TolC